MNTNKQKQLDARRVVSVRLTARDSICTSHHGLGGGTQIKPAKVIFAQMTMVVLFEETSNFFNVQLFNVPWLIDWRGWANAQFSALHS